MLYETKVDMIISKIINKSEKIILGKKASQKPSSIEKGVTKNASALPINYVEIKHVRAKVTSALLEIAQVSQKIHTQVIGIFTRDLRGEDKDVIKNAIDALEIICQSKDASEDVLENATHYLMRHLMSKNKSVQTSAFNALASICQSKNASKYVLGAATHYLMRHLEDEDKFMQINACNVLASICQSKDVSEDVLENATHYLMRHLMSKKQACANQRF